MILYELEELDILFATNPKSGVTYTNNLLKAMAVKYNRRDCSFQSDINKNNIIFVFRDPYQRVVSMFLRLCRTFKSIEEHKRNDSENLLKQLNYSETGITFNQFLDYLSVTPETEKNIHYRKQDIPNNYEWLVRTHKYRDDLLLAAKELRNIEFSSKLSKINLGSIKSNPSSNTRVSCAEDLSSMTSNDILDKYKKKYPLADSFLNKKNIPIIENLFSEEIDFARCNNALQRACR